MDNNFLFFPQKLIKEYWKSDKKLPWVPEVFSVWLSRYQRGATRENFNPSGTQCNQKSAKL